MKNPARNNQEFLAQLHKSHAAFTARAADFAGYPVDLAAYDNAIDAFEAAVTAETRYETETLATYRTAREEYQTTMAAARAKLDAVKAAADAEKETVQLATDMTREAAEKYFQQYQNIAEAVYLGSRRDDVLAEFDVPSRSYAAKTAKIEAAATTTGSGSAGE